MRRPTKYSVILASIYSVLCTAYIVWSSNWAAQISNNQLEQELIERYKGLAFVLFSGILIFLLMRHFMLRQESLHAELINKQEDLQISERKFLAGSLANTLAHDANHLLGSIGFRLENLKRQLPNDIFQTDFSSIETAMQKMSSLFKKIQINHRKFLDVEKLSECDLALSLEKNVQLIQSHPLYEKIHFEFQGFEKHPKCYLNCDLFEHMTYNLILNASQAALSHTSLPQVYILIDSTLAGYILEIHDNGPGIPENLRSKVTRPYFSTKREGAGLGFQTVHSFLQSQVGELKLLKSELLGGARVRIEFSHKQYRHLLTSEISK